MNEGIRPHLTKWQARFRKWYNIEMKKEENQKLSPQELQRRFPEHEQLVKEMLEVNKRLIGYREILKNIAMGE